MVESERVIDICVTEDALILLCFEDCDELVGSNVINWKSAAAASFGVQSVDDCEMALDFDVDESDFFISERTVHSWHQ
jgi:hypothetical protein